MSSVKTTNILAILFFATFTTSSIAYDLGEFGDSFGISEESIIKRMASEASTIDSKEIAEKKKDDAKEFLTSAPKNTSLGVAQKAIKHPVRHSLVVLSDFYVPVLVDKETGQVARYIDKEASHYRRSRRKIASKGDKINPLDRPGAIPPKDYLVFNPEIKSQRKLAYDLASRLSDLTLVATHGDLIKMSKESDSPVHLLMPSLADIYQVEKTPSLLTSGTREGEKVLVVSEIPKSVYSSDTFSKKKKEEIISSLKWGDKREVTTKLNPKKQMKKLGAPDALFD